MKKVISVISIISMISAKCFCAGGEIIFRLQNNTIPATSVTISILQVANTNSWGWNEATSTTVYRTQPFAFSESVTSNINFDAPKSADNTGAEGYKGVLPWGIYDIAISIGGGAPKIQRIDFRDERWSTDDTYYAAHDKNIFIDISTGLITIEQVIPYGETELAIWTIFGNSSYSPLKNNFSVPITLSNIIGSENPGGTLHAGSETYIASGATAYVIDSPTFSVGTDNERFSNYQGSGVLYKHNNWNQISTDINLSRSIIITSENNQQDAHFTSLFSACVKAELIENSASNEIEIRDPWYVSDASNSQPNTFYSVLSTNNYIPTGKYNETSGGVFLNYDPATSDIYYSVRTPLTKTFNNIPSNFSNWSSTNVDLPSPTAIANDHYETPAVFRSGASRSITANYKGSLATNLSTAMDEPSQHKIVRSGDGTYFVAYESTGKLWAEYSTNEGSSWHLVNNGYIQAGATTPSMVPMSGNAALLVFDNGGGAGLKYITPNSVIEYDGESVLSDYDDEHITPVVGYSEGGEILVLWRMPGQGIHYSIGRRITEDGYTYTSWFVNAASLSGTNGSSFTPTVDCKSNVFQIAWQQEYSEYSSKIKYTSLVRQQNGTYTQGPVTEFNSGFPVNSKPSIIATSEPCARVTWIGSDPEDPISGTTIFHEPDYYAYWQFGWGVSSAHVNQAPGVVYVIGWVNANCAQQYTTSAHLSNPQSLSTTGSYLQIANGTTTSNMRALGFNTGSSPYRFNFSSSSIPYYKMDANAFGIGRGGIIALGDAQFTFLLGDIMTDGERIDFTDMPDTVNIDGEASLNSYLETKPFTVNDKTTIAFSVEYWTADSSVSAQVLNSGNDLTFTVEAINAESEDVIGTLKNTSYLSGNIEKYNNQRFEIAPGSMSTAKIKLRMRVHCQELARYAVVSKAAIGPALSKGSAKEAIRIDLRDEAPVTSYALEQNYPNPFNPLTTIDYQLPKGGIVTLAVYDLLGKEVGLLVSESKRAGRYSARFNASELASGTYVVRLNIRDQNTLKNTFTKTMKVMLVK